MSRIEKSDQTFLESQTLKELVPKVWSFSTQYEQKGVVIQENIYIVETTDPSTSQRCLLLFNAAPLTGKMIKLINSLDLEVKYIVPSNKGSLVHVGLMLNVFPEAHIYAPERSLNFVMERIQASQSYFGKFFFGESMLEKDQIGRLHELKRKKPSPLPDEFQYELFQGNDKEMEVVLLHKPSKVLFTSHLATNIGEKWIQLKNKKKEPKMILWAKNQEVLNTFAIPKKEMKRTIKQPQNARENINNICSWDFDSIGLVFGEPISNTLSCKKEFCSQWNLLLDDISTLPPEEHNN